MLRRFEESVYDFFLCQRTLCQLHSSGRRLPREMAEIIARKIMMEQWMREPIMIMIDNVIPDDEEPITIHFEWRSSRDTSLVVQRFLRDIHKRVWFDKQLWINFGNGQCAHRDMLYIGTHHLTRGEKAQCEWLNWQCRSVLTLKRRGQRETLSCSNHESDTMGLHIVLGEIEE